METLIGFLIAIGVGMTGMGGGALTAPVLILFLSVPTAEAVGTSLIFATVTKLVAAPVYLFRRQVAWDILLRLLMGGVPGVILGSLLMNNLVKKNMEPLVLFFVGLTILVMAFVTLVKMLRVKTAVGTVHKPGVLPFFTFPIGIEVGFSSAGAGALGGLLLMHATTLSAATIVGTDMMFGWLVAMLGGGLHLAFGEVNRAMVVRLLTGGVLGALTGAWLATRMPSRKLRLALTCFLIFLGGQLSYRGLQTLVMR